MLVKKCNCSFPREFGIGFVVAWRCVVVEAVVAIFVHILRVFDLGFFKGFFIGGPAFVDPLIKAGIMQHERGPDLCRILCRCLTAIVGNGGLQFRIGDGGGIADPAAVTKADDPDIAAMRRVADRLEKNLNL